MEWAVWRTFYLQIVNEFGYDMGADLESAKRLSELVDPKRIPNFSKIVEIFGRHVTVAGAAASLERDMETIRKGRTIISAGSATGRLMRAGMVPQVLVTDLDGDWESELEAIEKGALAFIHAHGDNIPAITSIVPGIRSCFVPTVQCKPFANVYNFGGFTDGDRAVLIAKHFGAHTVETIGWDLSEPYPKKGSDMEVKIKKLRWAQRILANEPPDRIEHG